jgi:AraC-like DNA-binding protein
VPNNLRYDYAGDRRLLEGADWIGRRSTGLHLHFHDEVQVSVVWGGMRDYRVGTRIIRVQPGQMLVTPARRPHQALPSLQPQVRSVEFYLAPTALDAAARRWLESSDVFVIAAPDVLNAPPSDAAGLITGRIDREAAGYPPLPPGEPAGSTGASLLDAVIRHDSIHAAAGDVGLSREGFIRAFFRSRGMTPHAYKINDRLNRGRQLLRQGERIADVAQAAGFSDQSHFGRAFLDYFGATPGDFRAAHRPR